MRVSKIRTEEAVGQILPHDLTRIVPGKFKGAAFKKGHCLVPEDIPELLRMGRDSIYVLELEPDEIHEDEAGTRLGRAAAGAGVTCSDPQESRVNLFASRSGLLKINVAALEEINDLPSVVLSTLPNNTPVAAGDLLAGTKVIPLAVKKEVVQAVEQIAAKLGGVVSVIEYRALDVGIIVTGNEVFHKRINDRFGPVLRDKVSSFGSRVLDFQYAPDDPERIAELIDGMIAAGAQLLLVSGGMSVDPDDVTPQWDLAERGGDRDIRGAGAARGDVSAGLSGRGSHHRGACLRHVFSYHHSGPGAAAVAGRRAVDQAGYRIHGPWRPVQSLPRVPLPAVQLRPGRLLSIPGPKPSN